jgi:hypothetical protein
MGKSRKRTTRGDQYQTMAAGYQLLQSPLAGSYRAAAEHYWESDPPLEPHLDQADPDAAQKSEP